MTFHRARFALPFVALVAVAAMSLPAGAFHLFPLVPGDPAGDCGATLAADPGGSASHVSVEAFFFVDDKTRSSTTDVKAGDSVTWRWDLAHCHSVTFTSVPEGAERTGTFGGPPAGFDHKQPELVRPADAGHATFTVAFTVPGTYEYICTHHKVVGMVGKVLVRGS